jgi:hypothetical protein
MERKKERKKKAEPEGVQCKCQPRTFQTEGAHQKMAFDNWLEPDALHAEDKSWTRAALPRLSGDASLSSVDFDREDFGREYKKAQAV